MLATALPLPPVELRFMGEDDERLIRQGREMAGQLVAAGMRPGATVLDVGCGYGRLALGLLADGRHEGRYIGFDILPKHIAWCRHNITKANRRYVFRHVNAHNARYNPRGDLDPDDIQFPFGAGRADMAAVFSVFTHLYRSTIEHYLGELRRTLRPGGRAVTTWLLWDEERLPAVTAEACSYPLVHELDADTRYSDPDDPLRAIAFTPRLAESMIRAAGLEIRSVTRGSWDGVTASDVFQDVIVVEAPNPLRLRLRRAAGRAKRALVR